MTMTATAALADVVRCPVFSPGEPGFAEEIAGFNLATTHAPDVAVGATSATDIARTVQWAAARGLPVAVQATGHGANLAIDRGVLISTRRMDQVSIDPDSRLATVAAGATWKQVNAAAAPHGLAGLNGSSSGVSVAGYTVGGGLPVLGRAFGYAADYVRRFDVVTADGKLHHTSADTEPELFWALRGGKGNVGIVTSLQCELLPLSRIYGGAVFYPGDLASLLVPAYAEWVQTLPEQTGTALQLLRLPPFPDIPEPLRGQFVTQLCVAHVGDPAEGERLLAPMRAAAPAIVDTVSDMAYADIDHVYSDPDHPVPAAEGCLLLRELSAEAVQTLLDLAGPQSQSPLLLVGMRHLGGALSRPSPVEDAICARDAAFLLQTVGILAGPHAAAVPTATVAVQAAMAPYSTGRTMVNLHGTPGDAADRARAWSPTTYDRLCQAKRHYDPQNLLRFGHAVVPA
jgi:FAD/FMN-containing dehydrogenase